MTIISRCQASIYLLIFWNVYRFHFHLFLYVSLSNFLTWGAENLYTSSLKWQHWGIWVRLYMTRKILCMFIAAIDLVCLQSEILLNNSGDRQNNQSNLSGLVSTSITHLAFLQSLLIKLTSLQKLSSCQTRSLGPSKAVAKLFPSPGREEQGLAA